MILPSLVSSHEADRAIADAEDSRVASVAACKAIRQQNERLAERFPDPERFAARLAAALRSTAIGPFLHLP